MKRAINISLLIALGLGLAGALSYAQTDDSSPPRGQRPPGDGQRPPPPPIIAALDSNGDGVIDEQEIAQASTSLKKLDKNGDGKLTPDEYRPPRGGGMGMGGPGQQGGQPRGQGRPGGPPPSGE